MGMEAESLAAPTFTLHEPQERDFTLECEALITQLFELGRSSAIPGNQKKKKKKTISNTMKDIKVNREGHYGGINCSG